ncbi:MAG: hypothetical protein JWO82_2981 [Akkermansiaceae bacterium]|nr:hypothetical protein [Akkermansiaceae bacterium]
MQDPFQHARDLASRWREANGATGGVVLVVDGLFVGHAPELPPAAMWVPGCLAIAGDGRAHYIHHDWRRPLEWIDLEPPAPEAGAAPPPSPEPHGDPAASETESTTEP